MSPARKPKRRRRPFVEMRPSEIGSRLSGEVLFLGRLDAAALRRELAEAGILRALSAKGYPEVVIQTAFEDGEHRLQIHPRRGRRGVVLVDLRLAEVSAVVDEPWLRQRGVQVLSCLSVLWLSLQDPRGRFTAERPRLPGQNHPGLGLGRRLYERVLSWARAWGKDGVMNVPGYFHNAVFYGSEQRPSSSVPAPPVFRFLAAERQGRFLALCRDLAPLSVNRASWAIDDGRVVEEPSGRVLRWEPGEMVAPVSVALADFLDSQEYRRAVEAARDAVRYRFSPPQSSQGQMLRSHRKL